MTAYIGEGTWAVLQKPKLIPIFSKYEKGLYHDICFYLKENEGHLTRACDSRQLLSGSSNPGLGLTS